MTDLSALLKAMPAAGVNPNAMAALAQGAPAQPDNNIVVAMQIAQELAQVLGGIQATLDRIEFVQAQLLGASAPDLSSFTPGYLPNAVQVIAQHVGALDKPASTDGVNTGDGS